MAASGGAPGDGLMRIGPDLPHRSDKPVPSVGEKRKDPPPAHTSDEESSQEFDCESDWEQEHGDEDEPFPVEAVETPGGSRYGVRRVLVPDVPSGGRLEEELLRRADARARRGSAMVAPSDSPSY